MEMIKKVFETEHFDNFSNIKRWNTKVTSRVENLAEHTHFVSLFSMFLSDMLQDEKSKLELLQYSILHDADELFTGDIGHELKYNKLNGKAIRDLIDDFVVDYVSQNFGDKQCSIFTSVLIGQTDFRVKKIVKLADWLSMVFFLNRQIKISNELINEYNYCIDSTINHCEELFDMFLADGVGFFKTYPPNMNHPIVDIMQFINDLKPKSCL